MKECPKCKTLHNKSGKFCSRTCANSRVRTAETKQKTSDSLKKFYETADGSILKNKLSAKAKNQKHSEDTKKKISESIKRSISEDERTARSERQVGKKHSESTRQKLSDIAKGREFGGNTSKQRLFFKKNDGSVVYLQSSYEIEFAKILEYLGIPWSRPNPLKWVDVEGKSHRYYPDFQIESIYIDTKNDYLAIVDLPKIEEVRKQNNVDIRIVTKDMITEEYISSLVQK